MKSLPLVIAIGLLAAGCGGEGQPGAEQPSTTSQPATTTTATVNAEQDMSLELYFLAPDGKLVATSRSVKRTQAPGGAVLRELVSAPEGATTKVPDGLELTIADGKAHVTGAALDGAALA